MSHQFTDSPTEVTNFDRTSNVASTKSSLVTVEVQTGEEFLPKKVDQVTTTADNRTDVATAALKLKLETVEVNPQEIQKFLAKVTPIMLKELQPNPAYQYLEKRSSSGKMDVVNQVETDSQYTVSEICCNCTGATYAVALKMQNHYGFCRHSSQLFLVPAAGGQPKTFPLDSCATALAYHPHYPAIIAIGHHTGEITIIKSEEVWATTKLGEQHTSEIVSLDWITERNTVTAFVSASLDGLICVWTLKGRNTATKVLERVSTSKVFDKNGSITSLAVIPGSCDAYVGLFSGMVVRIPLPYESNLIAHERQFYEGHTGPVPAIAICPVAPGLFVSAGTDESIQLRNAVSRAPLYNIDAAGGRPLTDIKWSPFSPSIFAAIAEDKLVIVDLAVSTSIPVATLDIQGAHKVAWNLSVPGTLAVGTNDGKVAMVHCTDGTLDQKPGANMVVGELEAQAKFAEQ
ncbi:hypothetical protein TVAG_493980 [Trichomonas vaginalis G3]|uniref:Uncharacterized protein n=1 Tax=Trichomonas vaginalis (strain ATCC PRA-98 / G3) TaxID=412133 RepID=A2DQ29_TRIV3|nr:dynein heavy chain binding [Trichomonas vaginalis G3]EAY17456.1 hypothetical protein TVAG_493980 [Trichomonas vaginalis G3]KAI5533562.1 dynein heavy chain binding [Trichomonas vaginalis G3]|eukprot:XP_001329591.1 hypothetical protein [Trichomonas vaginalis G3]